MKPVAHLLRHSAWRAPSVGRTAWWSHGCKQKGRPFPKADQMVLIIIRMPCSIERPHRIPKRGSGTRRNKHGPKHYVSAASASSDQLLSSIIQGQNCGCLKCDRSGMQHRRDGHDLDKVCTLANFFNAGARIFGTPSAIRAHVLRTTSAACRHPRFSRMFNHGRPVPGNGVALQKGRRGPIK